MSPFGVRVAIIEPGVVLTPIFFNGDDGPPVGTHYANGDGNATRFFTSRLAAPTMPEVVAVFREVFGLGI